MTRNKVLTIVWVSLIVIMLIAEGIIVAIPKTPTIDVASPQLMGQQATSPTTLSQILNSTPVPTPSPTLDPALKNVLSGMTPVIVIVFIIGMFLIIVRIAGSDGDGGSGK